MYTLKDLELKSNAFYLVDYPELEKIRKSIRQCDGHSGNCLNNFECSNFSDNRECPKSCNKKQRCKNRRIDTHLNQFKLEIRKYKGKGSGVRTLDFIPAGSFVIEYVGFIRTEDKYEKLWNQYPGSPFYGMDLDDKWVIDATKEGNLSRMFSHSCSPNLSVEQWYTTDGFPRIILQAIEDILPGTELAYDYGACKFKGNQDMTCLCKKPNCKWVAKKKLQRKNESLMKFKCSNCSVQLESKYTLKRHEDTMHNAQPFKCSICDKTFTRKDSLRRHLELHEGKPVKKYQCKKCEKKFRLKHHLHEHMERHSKDRAKNVCGMKRLDKNKLCKKFLVTKRALQVHRRINHR